MQSLKLSEIVTNWYKKNLRILPWRPKNFNQKILLNHNEINKLARLSLIETSKTFFELGKEIFFRS